MPITSASRPVTLRKMMRLLRLEKATRTKKCQPCSKRTAKRRRPVFASDAPSSRCFFSSSILRLSSVSSSRRRLKEAARAKSCQPSEMSSPKRRSLMTASARRPSKRRLAWSTRRRKRPLLVSRDKPSSGRSGARSVLKLSGVRLSTVGLPVARPHPGPAGADLRRSSLVAKPPLTSHFFEPIADAVERFDHIEIVVAPLELLAQSFDVAVDRAVVHIDLVVIGRIHQCIAALDHARPARERLQDKELRYRQRNWLVFPRAGVPLGIHAQ